MVYPAGPLVGVAIKNAYKKIFVGLKWSSGNIIPLGEKTLKKITRKNKIEKISGQYEIIKIKNSIAEIFWNGEAEMSTKYGGALLSWKRTIKYDLKNQRFINDSGLLKINYFIAMVIYKFSTEAFYK